MMKLEIAGAGRSRKPHTLLGDQWVAPVRLFPWLVVSCIRPYLSHQRRPILVQLATPHMSLGSSS